MRPKQGLKHILSSINFLDQDKQHGLYTKKPKGLNIQKQQKKSKEDWWIPVTINVTNFVHIKKQSAPDFKMPCW
jgi:hypothetical protein